MAQGARHLILMGRRVPTPEADVKLKQLEQAIFGELGRNGSVLADPVPHV